MSDTPKYLVFIRNDGELFRLSDYIGGIDDFQGALGIMKAACLDYDIGLVSTVAYYEGRFVVVAESWRIVEEIIVGRYTCDFGACSECTETYEDALELATSCRVKGPPPSIVRWDEEAETFVVVKSENEKEKAKGGSK